jgi:hypothetical protein
MAGPLENAKRTVAIIATIDMVEAAKFDLAMARRTIERSPPRPDSE